MTFIDSYLDFTKHQETTERIHRWVGILIAAAALERRCWLNRGPYVLFPNLYVFVIGPSGKVKKSTSTAIGVDLLRELPEFKIMSERLTAGSLITQLERSKKSFQFGGREILQSPSFAYGSELAVFLGEVFGSISELLTTFYDCVPNDSSKPWVYETKMNGISKVYGPCLNFLGASTPTWLTKCLPPSELEGGFASRVIFVVEHNQRQAIAWPDEHVGTDDLEAKRRYLMTQLKRIYAMTGPFVVSKELRPLGKAWYEEYSKNGQTNTDIRFSGYYARKFDTALKVAMTLSACEDDSRIIDVRHFEESLKLLNDVELSMFEAFGSRGENPNAELARRIWTYVAQHGGNGMPLSMAFSHVQRDASYARFMETVTDLRVMERMRQYMDPKIKDYVLQATNTDKAF